MQGWCQIEQHFTRFGVERGFRGAMVALSVLSCSACAGDGAATLAAVAPKSLVRAANAPARPTLSGKFSHVMVIVQENRSVDNLFNGFPGADTVKVGSRFGVPFALREIPLEPSINPDHSHAGFVADYDDGKMDGFDHLTENLTLDATAYAYVRPADVANYWSLASRFTLSDNVFQMNMGPSFSAHVNLVAAQGGYPLAFADNAGKIAGLPGCLGTSKIELVDLRTPFPGTMSQGPACMDMPTIFDLLDNRGLDWRYYAPAYGIGEHFWSAPDYITHIAEGAGRKNLVSPETLVLEDIKNGTLPRVSYVVPQICTSDHPHGTYVDPLAGPHWVAALTNAIGASKYWDDTLILVVWDDWGGWYDHKKPPIINANQLSFRTPLLVISAYPAAPGKPDHTRRNQASIMTAIESIFGLPSLGQLDAKTDDLSNDFDFTTKVKYGTPLPAATPPPGPCQAGSYGSGPDAKKEIDED